MKTERRKMVFAALIAVIATFMVGCSHENGGEIQPVDNNADIISFSSGSPETRTSYSGYVNNNKERVDWVAGDVVTIWSDKADDHSSAKKNYADYKAGEPRIEDYQTTDDQLMSTAPLSINSGSSLRWNSTDNNYQFWGAYPASKVTVAKSGDKANTLSPSFSASIPQAQAITARTYTTGEGSTATSTVKYEPSMVYAYMASYKQTAKTDETVKLPFTMAFTAFEFTVQGLNSEFVLKDFTLQSGLSKPGTTAVDAFPVTGTFTATWSSGTTTNLGWSFAAATGQTNDKVTITFPEGTKVSETDQVTFTVFALPQEMKNLTASFTIKDINGHESIKNLSLKTGGNFLTFAGCKKHKIGVLAIPTGWKFSVITLNLEAIDWNEIEKTTDDYAQATQFEVSGATLRDGDGVPAHKQSWFVSKNEPFTISYKVFLPEGGSWKIEPASDSDTGAFTVECSNPTTGVTQNGNSFSGSIASGANGTRITLTVTPTGDSGKTIWFKTYVTNSSNVTYSIDSETQLFDVAVDNDHPTIMRGYHMFTIQ